MKVGAGRLGSRRYALPGAVRSGVELPSDAEVLGVAVDTASCEQALGGKAAAEFDNIHSTNLTVDKKRVKA